MIRVPWISLANIALGRAVVPELYRDTATAEGLAAETLRLLSDPRHLDAQREAFGELATEFGEPGVGERVARLVLDVASGGADRNAAVARSTAGDLGVRAGA